MHFILASIFTFNAYDLYAKTYCSPVGQLSQLGEVKPNFTRLLQTIGEPEITSLEFNSVNCQKAKLNFSDKKYKKLQLLASAAEEAFTIVNQDVKTNGSACLSEIKKADEIFSETWKVAPSNKMDTCYLNQNWIKVVSVARNATMYVNKDLSDLLTSGARSSHIKRRLSDATPDKK
jgi:hypothetical protein